MIDYEKRKRIMGRSAKLGHCICNPKEPCPCDLFKQKNVCLCAGEREEEPLEDIPLTQLVESPGCASKINQDDLKKALEGLPEVFDERILVSSSTCDDAGVFRVNKDLALVQSVDVFTPCVDDPYIFGQIAAANSVSDIYAMGGKPLTALSIIGFPIQKLSHGIMNRMLQGGIDKLREAGVAVLGGHSIKDMEIKFGFAVTGVIDPQKIVTNGRARVGDALILTKPLGTGIVSFANQLGKASASSLEEATRSMTELNRTASELLIEMNVSTATDVTGFGLMGHLVEVLCQSQASAEIFSEQIPVFEGVREYARKGLISGAVERNREYASRFVTLENGISEAEEAVIYDPQTSGGLLVAIGEAKAPLFLEKLRQQGIMKAAVIGRIVAGPEGRVLVRKKMDIS